MTAQRQKEYRYQGINIQLISEATLQQASACLRVAVGSHHEPAAWPGLAHLLEHLLFQGGTRYRADQRLMPWVSRHHGRVNATTEACQTLYYFDVPQACLSEGIARLLDMARSPCFDPEAIDREITVIDAEYGLLSRHLPTLCQAFLADSFMGAEEYRRFVVGNRRSLGGDLQALRKALGTFHQQGYQPENLTLWVRADLPLTTLEQQVRHVFDHVGIGGQATPSAAFTAHVRQNRPNSVRAPLALPSIGSTQPVVLQASGQRHHLLSYLIDDPQGELLGSLPILQALISDASPGTLRHYWTMAGLCHDLQVEHVSGQSGMLWLLIRLTAAPGEPQPAGLLSASWHAWLRQLIQLTDSQRLHYRNLAAQQSSLLSPMEQLRKLASSQGSKTEQIATLAAKLLDSPYRELQSGDIEGGESVQVRGFNCRWQPAEPAEQSLPMPPQPFIFYPQRQAVDDIAWAPQQDTLPVCWSAEQATKSVTLLMRPQAGTTLTVGQYAALQQALAPFLSRVQHAAGSASLTQRQGIPWLWMSLPDSEQAGELLCLLGRCWPQPDVSLADDGQEIVIRRLLARFPALLADTHQQPRWCGLLQCADQPLFRQLDQQLQQGIPQLGRHDSVQRPLLPGLNEHLPAVEGDTDSALLFFLPVDHQDAEIVAAAQQLGTVYQPAFYQWLREEQAVGYVVSCRFERLADRAGILCALQSPHWDHQQLRTACEDFFPRISEKIANITDVPALPQHTDADTEAALRQELWHKISGQVPTRQDEDETEITPSQLLALHRHFCQQVEQAVCLSYGR